MQSILGTLFQRAVFPFPRNCTIFKQMNAMNRFLLAGASKREEQIGTDPSKML